MDALRSIKRYSALMLDAQAPLFDDPDPRARAWEVRLTGEKGVFHRPFARVNATTPANYVAYGSRVSRVIQTFGIVCFPVEMHTADEAMLEAERVRDLLWSGLGGPGVAKGRMFRVPLYNYDGVPVTGATAFVDESHRGAHDFMNVQDSPSVGITEDPDDELLFSIAVSVRMSWLRSAAVLSQARTTVSVGVEVGP